MESDTNAQEASDQAAYDEDMKACKIEKARRTKETEMKTQERKRVLQQKADMEKEHKRVSGEHEATVQYLKDLLRCSWGASPGRFMSGRSGKQTRSPKRGDGRKCGRIGFAELTLAAFLETPLARDPVHAILKHAPEDLSCKQKHKLAIVYSTIGAPGGQSERRQPLCNASLLACLLLCFFSLPAFWLSGSLAALLRCSLVFVRACVLACFHACVVHLPPSASCPTARSRGPAARVCGGLVVLRGAEGGEGAGDRGAGGGAGLAAERLRGEGRGEGARCDFGGR